MSSTTLASIAAATSLSRLVKTSNGEYTSGSVATNQVEALRLGLERQQDGNYAAPSWPLARSSSAVQTALYSLQLGG